MAIRELGSHLDLTTSAKQNTIKIDVRRELRSLGEEKRRGGRQKARGNRVTALRPEPR